MIAAAAALLSLASLPAAEVVDNDRIKVTAHLGENASIRKHTKAHLMLRKLAKRACKGKGKPVSEGTLHLETMPVDGYPASQLVVSEYYRCIAD
ncbi:hypothetical protein GRI43_02255 [Altererythrobacter luteolus]|uniref:UrcA family protein n=1 Tax=Pontixanthobacter luteolus TaxID=295089 RepID=A0A6I4V1F8_9SPHN|nr:hypothetical protein [Pontixanthobacter luteolus]MXP46214.1 hypothetical protein [Pontixanthobacter luteolus]